MSYQSPEVPSYIAPPNVRVDWYRTPLDKKVLAELNQKSDWKGLAQALGHAGLICATGLSVFYAALNLPWWTVFFALLAHGTVASFAINAVHELGHKSVFATQALNQIFLRFYGFIGWINFEHFFFSHIRHHQYTLHQPDDLEVVLPIRVLAKHFRDSLIFNPWAAKWVVKNNLRLARGQFEGQWEHTILPESQPEKRARVMNWSRFLLVAHGAIHLLALLLAVAFHPVWLLLPLVTSWTPTYGHGLFWLCNNTQHIGLQDDVNDFRLCCRTFTVNPLVRFLYWHMNYHIEHHMYAAVPCYNLGKLHRAIQHELPPCPHGIFATWKEIIAIQRRQEADPTYQYVAPIPVSTGRTAPSAETA